MMKNLCFLVLAFFFSSCSTPYKLLQNGNYTKARSTALKHLSKNKDAQVNLDVLIEAMDRILLEERTLTYRNFESQNPKDWKTAYKDSKDIANCILQTKAYTGDRYDQTLNNMDKIHVKSRQKLFDYYYDLGQKDLDLSKNFGNRAKAQSAHAHFCAAKKYAAANSDIEFMLEECLVYGTVKIAVITNSPFDLSLDRLVQQKFRRIEEHNQLFRIVDYQTIAIDHDVHINLQFDRDEELNSRNKESFDFEKDILVRTDRMRDTSGHYIDVPIYEKIRASVDVIQEIKIYDLDAISYVVDRDRVFSLGSQRFSEGHTETREYYKIKGDRRAVPSEYIAKCSRPVFNDENTYEELLDRMYREVSQYYF